MNEAKGRPFDDRQAVDVRISKLRQRIKNTSSVRFAAAKRVRFNYSLANLTIVVLSLWAITISFLLMAQFIQLPRENRTALEATGVLLPVFIVVFSLIENGGNYLRSYQLEANARQLRELADELSGEVAKIPSENNIVAQAELFEKFSTKYNDILERSPINHDDVDHYSKHYSRKFDEAKIFMSGPWWLYGGLVLGCWLRRQIQRACYLILWFIPLLAFSRWPFPYMLDFFQSAIRQNPG